MVLGTISPKIRKIGGKLTIERISPQLPKDCIRKEVVRAVLIITLKFVPRRVIPKREDGFSKNFRAFFAPFALRYLKSAETRAISEP